MKAGWIVLLMGLCACGPAKSGGATSGSGTSTDTATSTTGGGECPPNPAYSCAAPHSCDGDCGPLEQWDANGCMRPLCMSDGDCGAGEACYNPEDFGTCGGMTEECRDDWPDAPGQCACVVVAGGCPQGWCVDADDLPTGGTGGGPGQCGALGSHTQQVGDACQCEPGYEWCFPNMPDLLECCEPDGQCPDPNSTWIDGLCYCNAGYDWCDPNDPNDYSCCDGTGSTGTG